MPLQPGQRTSPNPLTYGLRMLPAQAKRIRKLTRYHRLTSVDLGREGGGLRHRAERFGLQHEPSTGGRLVVSVTSRRVEGVLAGA